MTYIVRMVRGKVVVSFLNAAGKVERSIDFEPDYAVRFAEHLTETADKARAYLADCDSD